MIYDYGEISELRQCLVVHNNIDSEFFSFCENVIGLRLWFVEFDDDVCGDITLQQTPTLLVVPCRIHTCNLDPSLFAWRWVLPFHIKTQVMFRSCLWIEVGLDQQDLKQICARSMLRAFICSDYSHGFSNLDCKDGFQFFLTTLSGQSLIIGCGQVI